MDIFPIMVPSRRLSPYLYDMVFFRHSMTGSTYSLREIVLSVCSKLCVLLLTSIPIVL